MHDKFLRAACKLVLPCLIGMNMPINLVQAAIMDSDESVSINSQTQNPRQKIVQFLQRDEVVRELSKQGIDTVLAQSRVAAMTDAEASQVAGQIDQLPAGGDILGLVFTLFIILLITDILGLTKVFPFTRSVR
jgi:hypothetical protein